MFLRIGFGVVALRAKEVRAEKRRSGETDATQLLDVLNN
jgi:hypothetical protein